jgi:protein-disulfide isomerase
VAGKMNRTLEILSSVVVTVAAALLIWTQFENRWSRPAKDNKVQDVRNLTIDASLVTHTRGRGGVALVEFTDYECPFCARHTRDTVPLIEADLLKSDKIRHVVFNFPLEPIHPTSRRASEAAECAARQGRYWQMHDRLFGPSKPEAQLRQLAEGLRLNEAAFSRCLAGEATDAITAQIAEGRRLKVTSTPTFFVGIVQADNSIKLMKRISGAVPFTHFQKAISDVSTMKQDQHSRLGAGVANGS